MTSAIAFSAKNNSLFSFPISDLIDQKDKDDSKDHIPIEEECFLKNNKSNSINFKKTLGLLSSESNIMSLNQENNYEITKSLPEMGISSVPGVKNSILKGGTTRFTLDPPRKEIKKRASFKDKLIEVREVENFKDFNYEHTYNIEEEQMCRCNCRVN